MLGFVLDALLAALEDVAAELVLESVESTRITFDSSESVESVESVESAVDSEEAGASDSLTTTELPSCSLSDSTTRIGLPSLSRSVNALNVKSFVDQFWSHT